MRVPSVESRTDLAQVPESPDLDAKPVESLGARPPAGPPMGQPNHLVPTRLLLVQDPVQQGLRGPAGRELEALLQSLEQVRIPLRPEEHPEELSPGPRVVPEPDPQPGDERGVFAGRTGQRGALDEPDHHVAVADPSDESSEPFESPVEGSDELLMVGREQLLPERETVAQPAHLAMEPVQDLWGRLRSSDDIVHGTGDLGEKPFQFRGERRRSATRRRADLVHDLCTPRRETPDD